MGDLVTTERTGAPYPTPARMGRPPKYSDQLAQAITDMLARGSTRTAAAEANGVNRETLREWMYQRDDFSAMVARAEAEAEVKLTETVFAGGTDGKTDGDWRPAVEWLKRRRRADYGDTLDVRKLDDDTILRLLRASQDQAAITEDGQPAITSGADDI